MSTVGKELQFVVLDVGPDMHPYLAEAGRNLFNLATARLLNKPSLEMAVVFYGTDETDNELNREFAAAGDEGQYTNMVTARELACVSMATLRALASVPRGRGPSDWLSALLLVIDMMKKADAKFNLSKYPRRIFLLSTFTQDCDLDADFLDATRGSLQECSFSLEVVAVGPEDYPAGSAEAAARDTNLEAIAGLLSAVPGSLCLAPRPGDVAGVFPAVHKDGNAAYAGPFTLASGKHINVKVYKKTNPEPAAYNCSAWELRRYTEPNPMQQGENDCWVATSRELRVVDDIDHTTVEAHETLPAYRYGKDMIPVADEDEPSLGHHPERCMQLLGFVDAEGDSAVPSYYLGCSQTKGCFVVLGEKEADGQAISALAHAMVKQKLHAVVRMVFRNRTGTPGLYLLTPLLAPGAAAGGGAARQLDALALNRLPFADDFRSVRLASFNDDRRANLLPTEAQSEGMAALVAALDLTTLGPGGGEALRPEDIISPVQQRFYHLIGSRALDAGYKFRDDEGEALTAAVCDPPVARFTAQAAAAAARLKELFPTQAPPPKAGDKDKAAAAAAARAGAEQALGAAAAAAEAGGVLSLGAGGARVVRAVGRASPVEDFEAMVAAGQLEGAINGMAEVVPRLVEDSVGGRLYPKAAACATRLRATCVEHKRPAPFNELLTQLLARFRDDPLHSGFAEQLLASGLRPISTAEVPSAAEGAAAVTPEEAAAFGARRQTAAAAAAPQAAAGQEEDEFADME